MGNCSTSSRHQILTAKMSHVPFESDINGNASKELEFQRDDDLQLLRIHSDSFFYMKNLRTKKKGIVLVNMVGKKNTFEMEPYFFGRINQSRSTEFLSNSVNIQGAFLVRNAENDEMDYTLVVKNYNYTLEQFEMLKYKINFSNGKFFVSSRQKYDTLPNLIYSFQEGVQRGIACQLTTPCHIVRDASIGLAFQNRWELPRTEIEFGRKFGSGHFGMVHIGFWRGTITVAIKSLKGSSDVPSQMREFFDEIRALQSINHPNLVQIYGVCTDKHPYLMITEFLDCGDLLSLLRQDEDKSMFNFEKLLRISLDIANGMCAVSKKGIVHRDLAARNILIDKWHRGKVGDFGMSCDSDYVGVGGSDRVLPIKWTAPEGIKDRIFTTKSDVWSYGIVLWETFSYGESPYASINPGKILRKISIGYRLGMPKMTMMASKDKEEDAKKKENIYQIMLRCWSKLPKDRPTFRELRESILNFDEFIDDQKNYGYVDLEKKKEKRGKRKMSHGS